MSSRSSSRTSPVPGSRSSPIQRKSLSPTPNSGNRTPHSTSTKSRKSHSSKKSKQSLTSTPFIYQLDYVDWIFIFILVINFFAFFTVESAKDIFVQDESLRKLDYKVGLKRFYLISVIASIIILVMKNKDLFFSAFNFN